MPIQRQIQDQGGFLTVTVHNTVYRHGDGVRVRIREWQEPVIATLYIDLERASGTDPGVYLIAQTHQGMNGNNPHGSYTRGGFRWAIVRQFNALRGLKMRVLDSWCLGYPHIDNGRLVLDQPECEEMSHNPTTDIDVIALYDVSYSSPSVGLLDYSSELPYTTPSPVHSLVGKGRPVVPINYRRGEIRTL